MTGVVTVNGSRGASPERTDPRTDGQLNEDLDLARCRGAGWLWSRQFA